VSEDRLGRAVGAIIRVGGGRGFVIRNPLSYPHLVVTAAHCLPHLPPPHLGSYTEERTYAGLLGPLGDAPSTAWAECLFVDPVADLAVLMCPDNQEPDLGSDAYEALVESMTPVPVRAAKEGAAWVPGLDGRWFRCDVKGVGSPLWIESVEPIVGGMSGSPIIQAGAAIGVVCMSTSGGTGQGAHLALDLPRRLTQRPRRPR